jgi:hypothetical protein
MTYIMRRTQLYLNEDLWNVLHQRALESHTTVSELVREAVRDRYLGKSEQRKKAMRQFTGIHKNRTEFSDPESYIRKLRSGSRLNTLAGA